MTTANTPLKTMLDPEFSIRDDFPPAQYEQWKELAVAALHGAPFDKKLVTHTYEGLDLQPVYSRRDELGEGDVSGLPGSTPFVRGTSVHGAVLTGWDLRQEHATPQLDVANEAILADLEGGVSSLVLVLIVQPAQASILMTSGPQTSQAVQD